MTGFHWPIAGQDRDLPARVNGGWAGSENTNRFFDLQDFFDRTKVGAATPISIVERLKAANASFDSYDRYTFYRLLAQLGTDSPPDSGKMNLNYVNIDTNGVVVPDMATNFIAWTNAVHFFTNAAIRLLKDSFAQPLTNILSTNFSAYLTNGLFSSNAPPGFNATVITNYLANLLDDKGHLKIQIYPTNFYTPSVHRLLQLAANMYDASSTNFFPSVFRPVFFDAAAPGGPAIARSNFVFIVDYQEVKDANLLVNNTTFSTRFRDLAIPPDRPVLPFDMVYGVPAVIGAKKGFPNFNRFSVNRDIQVRRDLYVLKDGSGRAFQTNQAYSLMISNILGVEGWNSYNAGYTGSVQVLAVGNLGYGLMNNSNQYVFNTLKNQYVNTLFTPPQGNTVVPNWPGSGTLVSGGVPRAPQRASFSIPISVISSNNIYLTNTAYRTAQGDLVSMDPGLLDNHDEFRVPTLRLNITNRLRFALVDVAANRILDYVNLNEVEPTLDITDLCTRNRTGVQECTFPIGAPISDQQKVGSLVYCTNRVHNPQNPVDLTFGVQNQMFISRSGHNYTSDAIWRSCTPLSTTQVDSESSQFNLWVQSTDIRFANQRMRAPFTAVRTIHHYVSWQANDPLVHYTVRDLKEQLSSPSTNMVKNARIEMDDSSDNSPMKYFADPSQLTVNKAYRPWGANGPDGGETVIPTTTNILVKDPLVGRSDDWDLTTNKFPNIGWLGRIHRGTPWQTVYFKSSVVDKLGTWGGRDAGPAWVAHNITNWDGFGSILFDAIRTDPTNDYRAADLFTTAFNDNSSRGKLSINQTNLAAWSAVLSGVSVPTNIMAASNSAYTTFIEPAGIYNPSSKPPVVQILEGINTVRTNFPGGTFSRLGDILYVPQLSLSSPYLTNGNAAFMSDEVYERIPQQILGLLRGGEQPRYVVYAFGQALKPAERSIMNNGPYFGLCTNYQVTAETTVRAVVRIDGSADPAQANNPDPARRYPLRAVVESYNVLGPYY